ncbi:MAG: CHAT domain-containing protein, partial [Blastocatellia bacterium]
MTRSDNSKSTGSPSPVLVFLCLLASILVFRVDSARAEGTAGDALLEIPRLQDEEVVLLEPGKPVERELSAGQAHSYRLTLAAGEYLRVAIAQRGVNVGVAIFGPDGRQIAEVDNSRDPKGLEEILFIAEAPGKYQLKVRAVEKENTTGRYEVTLKEKRTAAGQDYNAFAAWLFQQAGGLYRKRQFDPAISLAERAAAIQEKTLGPDHLAVAESVHALGQLYHGTGDFNRAGDCLRRALEIREKQMKPEDPLLIRTLNDLGVVYQEQGEYVQAEPLLDRALKIIEKLRGVNHLDVALALNNLGALYRKKGDYSRAESMLKRALEIREKGLKPENPAIAESLNNLAGLYADQGDQDRAAQLHRRSLEIRKKTLGPEDLLVARSLNNLASAYQDLGDLKQAEPLYESALEIYRKRLEPEHTDIAQTLNNLAVLTLLKGDYAKAEPMYQRALEIREKKLGSHHPLVAKTLDSFAVLYDLKGDIARAIQLRTRGLEIREHHLGIILTAGSEAQKRAYLSQATLSEESDVTISFHARSAPNDHRAASLALNLVLRRKGRVLDAMTDSIGALRRRLDPQDRELLEQLTSVSSRLATLSLSEQGAQYRDEIEKLETERQRLEAAISARSAEFRQQSQPATIESIQKLLPANAALVEIAAYRPFDPKAVRHGERYGDARYAAFVLKSKGPPAFVELGEAAEIDRAVDRLREALRDFRRRDVGQPARAVDQMVMQPIRPLLGKTRRVLLSPDGSLNLVPFAALVDPHNHYLVKHYEFSYLSSGRDLLRLQTHAPSRQGPLVVADPDFGEKTRSAEAAAAAGGFDLSQADFTPLPGTAEEARALEALLPQATVLTKGRATEAALKQADGPSILHVATHGFFFLKDASTGPPAPAAAAQRVLIQQAAPGQPSQMAARLENPLLRSGLGLAGANLRKSGDEDG